MPELVQIALIVFPFRIRRIVLSNSTQHTGRPRRRGRERRGPGAVLLSQSTFRLSACVVCPTCDTTRIDYAYVQPGLDAIRGQLFKETSHALVWPDTIRAGRYSGQGFAICSSPILACPDCCTSRRARDTQSRNAL